MKRNEKENRKRSLGVILAVALMSALTLAGCSEKENLPVTSDSTSEVVTSEPISEEPSEVVPEEIDLTLYTEANGKKATDLSEDMSYNELKVFVWKYECGAKAILSDGDSYVMEDDDDLLYLYYPRGVQNVKANRDSIEIRKQREKSCGFWLPIKGEDLEVTLTVTYEDGSEENITIYVTKDFEY